MAESDDPSTTDVTENQVTVTVTLSDDPRQMVTIPITRMDQDGASSDDYSGVPDDVVFSSGDTEKTFTFTATDDTEDDDDESVKLTFGTLPSDPVVVTAVSPDETVISITDDDTGHQPDVINPERGSLHGWTKSAPPCSVTVQLADAQRRPGNVTVTQSPITRMRSPTGHPATTTSGSPSYTFSDSTLERWTEKTFTVTAT